MGDLDANRALVLAFYNALAQGDVATLRALGRPDYIQHNPNFETGLEGLAKAIATRPPRPADAASVAPLEFVWVVAEGDLVVTLRRLPARGPRAHLPDAERAVVDIFRVQDGKVAEHWDYQEEFPRDERAPLTAIGRF